MGKKFNHLNVPSHWKHYWTKYPNGYTILEALLSWVSQVDEMVDNINDWNEYLDEFVETWDKDLQAQVVNLLNVWREDGTLDQIINENVFNMKADKAYVDQEFQNVNQSINTLNQELNAVADRFSPVKDKFLYVQDYGAVGDGETDDTQALQQAFDDADGHVIVFPPNKTFNISAPVIVDVNKVRGIDGNNACLHATADITILDVRGTHTGSANPDMTTDYVARNEMHPLFRNIRFYSSGHVGTAMRVTKTFGLQLVDCHIFNMKHGVEFYGVNRNVLINACQIWSMSGDGLRFIESDLHQFIMNACHISYCYRAFYSVDSDLFNFELTGNNIECNETAYVAPFNLIHIVGGTLEGLTAVGNNFEDHLSASDYLIKIEGVLDTQQVHFVGNEIGNGLSGTFYFNGGRNIVIANNTDTQGKGNFIGFHCTQELSNIVIEGNVFQPGIRATDMITEWTECSFLKINGQSDGVNTHYAGGIVVSNNVANLLCGHFVRIYNTRIFQINISDNNFDSTDVKGGFWENPNFYAIKISENIEYIRQLRISGNHYRGRNVSNSGIQIQSPIESLIIISENTFRQINSPNNLPEESDVVIIRDNIVA